MIEIVFSRKIIVPAASNLSDYAKSLTSNESIKLNLSETAYYEAVEGVPIFDSGVFEQYSSEEQRRLLSQRS